MGDTTNRAELSPRVRRSPPRATEYAPGRPRLWRPVPPGTSSPPVGIGMCPPSRRHERNLPRRVRPTRAGAGRNRPAGRAHGSVRHHPLHRSPAPCSYSCSPERGAHEQAPAADELVATARDSGQPQCTPTGVHGRRQACCSPRVTGRRRTPSWSSSRRFRSLAEAYYAAVFAPWSGLHSHSATGARQTAGGRGRTGLAALRACTLRPRRPASRGRRSPRRGGRALRRGGRALGRFGNVPERAYALLGQGRCLAALGGPRRGSRCGWRVSSSRRWDTGRPSRRRMRCSSERPRPLRSRRRRKLGTPADRPRPGGLPENELRPSHVSGSQRLRASRVVRRHSGDDKTAAPATPARSRRCRAAPASAADGLSAP